MTRESSTPTAPTAKVVTDARDTFFGYYPGAVAVVTSRDGDRRNVMSAGWHTALSADPPLYGVAVAPERHSYGLIRASGLFGVNFLPFALAESIAGAGLLSGAAVPDKLTRLGLAWSEDESGLPILDGAWTSYACRVVRTVTTGDHDFFVGDVLRVHYDPNAFDGRIQSSARVPGAIYYGRSTYEGLGSGPTKTVPPETFRDPEPDPVRDADRDSGRDSGRDPGRDSGREEGDA